MTDAVGDAAYQHGRGGPQAEAVLFVVVGGADGGDAGAAIDGGAGPVAQEERVGQGIHLVGQLIEHRAHLGQGVAVTRVGAQAIQIQLAGQQLVADVDDDDQHAGNALAERRAG